ncbi:MAG: (2Fe-2S)-binding protein [Thermodesulfobacteriota bacterium]
MRIEAHPILGRFDKGPEVRFTFDGRTLTGFEGEPVAVALRAAGVLIHRYTARRREPRGVFCAIGRCTDCVMVVDGVPNVRTCVQPLRAGMKVETQSGLGPEPARLEDGRAKG